MHTSSRRRGTLAALLLALVVFIGGTTPAYAALTVNVGSRYKSVTYEESPGISCSYGGGAVTAGQYWIGFSGYYAGCTVYAPKTVCMDLYREKTYLGTKVPDVRVDYACTFREMGLSSEGTGSHYYFGCSTSHTYGIRVTFSPHLNGHAVSVYRGGLVCQSW